MTQREVTETDLEQQMQDTLLYGPKITDISLRGVKYPVRVSIHGAFRAVVEGHELKAPTLRELQTQAERVPRRRVAVRFHVVYPGQPQGRITSARNGSVRGGTATGFHATNTDSMLVDWDGASRRGEQSGNRIENAVLIETDTQALEIGVLLKAKDDADQALHDWIGEHAYDVHQAVRDALNQAGDDDE